MHDHFLFDHRPLFQVVSAVVRWTVRAARKSQSGRGVVGVAAGHFISLPDPCGRSTPTTRNIAFFGGWGMKTDAYTMHRITL